MWSSDPNLDLFVWFVIFAIGCVILFFFVPAFVKHLDLEHGFVILILLIIMLAVILCVSFIFLLFGLAGA